MPNGVKYSTTTPSGSLRRDNVALGVNGNLGPTANTGFYSMPAPASGKYIINKVAASGVPLFFAPQSDTELIQFARNEGATGADTGSAAAVLAWIATQPNLEAANFEYENIVTDGLALNLDAGFVGSYPTTGTTWYDLSGNGNNGTLVNSPTFSSSNNGVIVFDGVDDRIFILNNNSFNVADNITLEMWVKLQVSQSNNLGFLIKYTGNDGYLFYVTNNSDKAFAFDYRNRDGTYYRTIGTTNIQDGVWKCLTVQKSGLYSRVYINSTLEGTTVASTVGDMSSNVDLNLGTDFSTYMNGQMGSFRIYNRVLTQAEITQNFNAQKGRFGL